MNTNSHYDPLPDYYVVPLTTSQEDTNKMLVIFDLDGTLYPAQTNAMNAANRALADIGYPPLREDQIPALLGTTTQEYCDRIIPGYSDREDFFRRVKAFDKEEIAKGVLLYDGVIEMLDTLESMGCTLGLCSNGTMEYIRQALGAAGILHRFCYLDSGAEDGKATALGRILSLYGETSAVMVGDRCHDFEGAAAVGIPSIAACYGYGDEREYAAASIRANIPGDIPGLVAQML